MPDEITRQADLLHAALTYADRGWPVLPLHSVADGQCSCGRRDCASEAKHPLTDHGVRDASADARQIVAWWTLWPTANVGIATGTVSGLLVVDIDPRHAGDDTLRELLRQRGDLPQTVECLTGGGGRHLYFRHPGGRVCNRSIGAGLDIRGDSGYVVAPPSLHASGRLYCWEVAGHPDDVAVAAMPSWLVRLVRADKPAGAATAGEEAWVRAIVEGADAGARNDTATRLAGYLLRRGVSAPVTAAWLSLWAARCRPPLDGQELLTIVRSVAQAEARRRGVAT